MNKSEEKAAEEFLKQCKEPYPGLQTLETLLKNGRDFLQHLGSTQYYSERLNKRVFILSLESESLLLRLDALRVTENDLLCVLQHGYAKKRKVKLDQKLLDAFLSEVNELESEAFELHEKTLLLTQDIEREFKSKT
jgi:hypothetical protein